MRKTTWIEFYLLGLLVVGTFCLRTLGQWDKVFTPFGIWFRGVDSWYHMRLVDYMMHNFPMPLQVDMYAKYPLGDAVGYYPLLSWITALPGQVFNYEVVGALIPPVLGSLILIPIYFLGKELFNSRMVGFLACLLSAILPGELFQRSLLGFTDHHILEAFFSTSTILFIVLYTKRPNLLYPILAGISLSLYLWSWAGGLFIILPILGWFVGYCIYKINRNEEVGGLCKSASIMFGIALVTFAPSLFLVSSSRMTLLLLSGSVAVPVLIGCLRENRYFNVGIWSATVIGLLAVFTIFPEGPFALRSLYLGGFGTTINEAQPTTLDVAFTIYGMAFFLFLGGLYYAIRNKIGGVFLVWALFLFVLTMGQRRWGYYFTIPLSLLASYFIFIAGYWVKREARPIAIGVICIFLILTTVNSTVGLMNLPNNITPNWYHALTWLRENTEEPFLEGGTAYYKEATERPTYGILSWWDYGHWIIRISKRVPLTSPTASGFIAESDVLISQSDEAANKRLGDLDIRYIILDRSILEGKWWAVVRKSEAKRNPEALRENSFAMRLWENKAEGWRIIYNRGGIRIYEKTGAS
jgi:dolichyl-diphosphooligosaccharide--protein glycosyltransferase